MKKRAADILVDDLINFGLEEVFLITGGGAMHLNDAFGRRKDRLKINHNHHEQAAAMGAEAYARIARKPALVQTTSGPGGINAINGVYGAWTDSVPMIVISGQIKRDTMLRNQHVPLRQMGDQETDIISLVAPIVKYAAVVQDPLKIREQIAKAWYLATHGRPGPVWLDIPIDVSSALVEEADLPLWDSAKPDSLNSLRGDPGLHPNSYGDFNQDSDKELNRKTDLILQKLAQAKRPVILAGNGVHASGMEKELLELAEKLGIPVTGGWGAYDLVPSSHPCYSGRPGTIGDRAGNFTIQNADFLLILGSRLNIRQISYNWDNFAKNAWKAQVDTDPAELNKKTLHNDLTITADLRRFIPLFQERLMSWRQDPSHREWLAWCRERVEKYPVSTLEHRSGRKIHPYYFLERVFAHLDDNDVVVTANGAVSVIGNQIGEIKPGVRIISNSGCASMGYELPAAIGAVRAGAKRVICLAGDGSIMMNLQELQTIAAYKLPILIILLNNNGYLSIRLTQSAYFPDNQFGTGPENGVTFPDFQKIAQAFNIPCSRIDKREEVESALDKIFSGKLPAMLEAKVDPEPGFEPRLTSRKLPDGSMLTPELDDMAPFLSQSELAQNRID